jgi:hypothetical protein
MKNTVFWDATPCSLVYMYQNFGGTCCLHLRGRLSTLKTEAAGFCETLATIYRTTWHCNQEASNLRRQCRMNLEYQLVLCSFPSILLNTCHTEMFKI